MVSTQHARRHRPGGDCSTPDIRGLRARTGAGRPGARDAGRVVDRLLVNPTGKFVDRRPDGRRRADRPQDHRRHLRRLGPPRRRRLLRQGPVQGGPRGGVRDALGGQERGRRRPGRPVRGPGGLRDRQGHARSGCSSRPSAPRRSTRSSRSRTPCSRSSTCGRGPSSRDLDLLRPIYAQTAAYGHFGRTEPDFSWERTDRADQLRAAACAVSRRLFLPNEPWFLLTGPSDSYPLRRSCFAAPFLEHRYHVSLSRRLLYAICT